MKCPSEGKLQAYIDGELHDIEKHEIETHLFQCKKCKETYTNLNSLNTFTRDKMQGYQNIWNKNENKIEMKKFIIENPKQKRGVFEMIKNYKKVAAAACAAVIITTCATVQPIQAAITNAASIFRVQNIKTVNVSLEDMKKLQQELESKKADIQIDNIGKVKYEGGNSKTVTLEEAKKSLPFTVLVPQKLQQKTLETVSLDNPTKIDFTINISNVNQLLKTLGGKTLLPKTLDGKTFTFDFSGGVQLHYNDKDSKKYISLYQCKTPEINAPKDVDVNEIINVVSDLSILSHNLQTQLKSMKDLKNTLYVPNVNNSTEEITVDGTKVIATLDKNYSNAMFLKNGVLFELSGAMDKNEMIEIIKSLR